MKQIPEGIHIRLNQLLFKIGAFEKNGGYDYKFHAKKIAEEYNLKTEDIIEIMELSDSQNTKMSNALFNRYFHALKDGEMTMEEIRLKEKERSEKAFRNFLNIGNQLLSNKGISRSYDR